MAIPLRELRMVRGLSGDALAAAAGVSNKTVSDIELGKRPPRLATMRRIGAALGVELTEVEEFRAAIEEGLRRSRKNERPEE